ncbi:type II secretion system F family protein [Acidisphaera sp. S103]|uniref:type II secretion system F family protein n=1 Tax=Acidisphaera sp. S103 TaxID=1747223 RepID=UPI00131A912F|nr:type II secretion system F family protein [Acidisphaera sp. S103]
MPAFRYTALSDSGTIVRGVMQAANEAAATEQLRQRGQVPIDTVPDTGRLPRMLDWQVLGAGRAELSRQAVTDFTRELAVMLSAGQDLDRAMRFLVDSARTASVRTVLTALRDRVRNGSALAVALAAYPRSFPKLYVGLVRAGESSGDLAAALERLAVLLERERALAATIKSAMIYPALLSLAAIGSITLLLTEVLPQFVPLFEQNGAQLPQATRIMIGLGAFVSQYGLLILAMTALTALAFRQALRQPGPRAVFDRLLLRLPVIGGLAQEVLAARFSRTFGTLLQGGVPLIAALTVVQDVLGNAAGSAAVEAASSAAKGGASLADPLEAAGVFPIRMIHLLRVGQETAQLGVMALRAADIHEERTRIGVQRLLALLTPAITIVMGAAIAGIVTSLLLAMLSLNDLANG